MILLWVGLAALFVVIGWGVHVKKWYFLISGYNMMTKEEQAKVDVEPLAKSLATMSYIIAGTLLVMGLGIELNINAIPTIATVILVVVPIFFVIKAQKYYNGASSKGSSKKSKKISIAISAITLLIVAIIIYFSVQPTKFDITDEHFSISGMYGGDYEWSSINELELLEQLPEIAMRTNGSAVGSKLKGHFKFENDDKAVLFLDKNVPPFIRIDVDGKTIIFNEPSKGDTEALFETLKTRIQ